MRGEAYHVEDGRSTRCRFADTLARGGRRLKPAPGARRGSPRNPPVTHWTRVGTRERARSGARNPVAHRPGWASTFRAWLECAPPAPRFRGEPAAPPCAPHPEGDAAAMARSPQDW